MAIRRTPVPPEISESFGQACAVEGVRIAHVLAIRKLTVQASEWRAGLTIAFVIQEFYQDFLSGFTIAFAIHSVDRSLFSPLISYKTGGRSRSRPAN